MRIERTLHVRDGYMKSIARRFPAGGGPSVPIALPTIVDRTTLLAPRGVRPVTMDTLPTVLDLCRRIAPWIDVVFTPLLLSEVNHAYNETAEFYEVEGVQYTEILGQYHRRAKTIFVSLRGPMEIYTTAIHECWHAIDTRLSDDWKAQIDESLSPSFYGDGHRYWSDPEERRCRAFEAWCLRLVNGLPGAFVRTRIDEIFALAWSGELGEELLAYPQPVEESA